MSPKDTVEVHDQLSRFILPEGRWSGHVIRGGDEEGVGCVIGVADGVFGDGADALGVDDALRGPPNRPRHTPTWVVRFRMYLRVPWLAEHQEACPCRSTYLGADRAATDLP